MTDTVNKQALQAVVDRIQKQQDAEWTYEPGLGEVVEEILDELKIVLSTPPTTPVQGYREALEAIAESDDDWYVGRTPMKEYARQALSQTDIQPSGWIPVAVKLPEHKQKVMLHFNDGGMDVGYITNYDGKLGAIRGQMVCQFADITHWIPLPNPPGINSTEDDQPGPSSARSTGFKCSRCGSDIVVDDQGSSFRHICTEEEETDA